MSLKPIAKDTIDRMTSTALSGDLNTAFAVLNLAGLNEGQKAKIAGILKELANMRHSIIAVVGEENIATTTASGAQTSSSQSAPPEQVLCISFSDTSEFPFGNAYPCTFGLEGKLYQNAMACFLAHQYTDQPAIMNLFTTLNPEEAAVLSEFTPMTKERKISWEMGKDDVLMNVLRAKFGQNTELKEQLLATGGAYLVCQGRGLHLSDNFNGTGKNILGASLMRLRGEYGGTSQVAPPAEYLNATQSLQTRCHVIANEFHSDTMPLLFNICLSECDFMSLAAMARLNNHWNAYSIQFWEGQDLKQLCPELTILDANAQGVKCEDEPKIGKPLLLKWVREISPHVEDNAGVTQLTIPKGTTLNQLIKIAEGEGVTVVVGERAKELGDVPVEQTYSILITNSLFKNSRNKNFNLQKILVEGHGCEMPTVQEYVALCAFTNKVYKRIVYRTTGQWTFGRTSTHVKNNENNDPLAVGYAESDNLNVRNGRVDDKSRGAGGKKKF